ncbi:hypothetical protein BJ944DRAFT_245233 [Cunninghamella echinulata]|nr:hypothetical protein BJ944DRAFT_245233 [Cunninghamella echinulata]
MNTLDFLSSDIEFPCDSNEPKLSASPCSKLPESVDWAFHDFYSTILEKEFTPIESLTEMKYLEPIKQNKEKDYLRDWKHSSIFTVQDKQEDQAVVFVVAQSNNNHRQQQQNNNTVTAALKGALYSVEMDMQQNMHDTLRSPLPSKDNNYISWKDDLFADTFYNTANNNVLGDNNNNMMSMDQDLWDDDIELGPPSPAYHSIHDNLVLDSSLPSRISSIMMPTSNTTTMMNQQQPMPITIVSEQPPIPSIQVISTSLSNQDNNNAAAAAAAAIDATDATDDQYNNNDASVSSSSPSSSTVAQDPIQIKASPSSSSPKKSKSWAIWNKVKQVAQPLKKSFKSSNHTLSTKNAFKRLFQH